jgi:uncharacterized protein (TIGR03067 family)
MATTRVFLLALAGLLPLVASGQGPAERPAQDLQGTWRLLTLEHRGKKTSLENEERYEAGMLRISGKTFTYWIGKEKVAEGTFRSDARRAPRRVDASGKYFDGGVAFIQWAGIYKVEGDRLWLCGRLAAGRDGPPAPEQRPTEFRTADGDLAVLGIFRREQP